MHNFNYVLNTPLPHGWGQRATQELSRLKVSRGWLQWVVPHSSNPGSTAPTATARLTFPAVILVYMFLVYFTDYTVETKVRIWLYSQELNVWHSFILLYFRFYQKGLITYQCWCHVNYIKMKNLHENKSSAFCAEFHMTSQKIITFLYNLKFFL